MHLNTKFTSLATIGLALASDAQFAPNRLDAEKNAYTIFNSIHSAGRQWGSGIYHNGFGLIPAIVPRGSLFYHGTTSKDVPKGPEWLAFEPEAAEGFAGDWPGGPNNPNRPHKISPVNQKNTAPVDVRRYVHTYRNNRDLKLLLIDGMSAGKTNYGTLDTQDLVLLEGKKHYPSLFDDPRRAEDLCKVVQPWGYDGLIRSEIGFEIIHCNFTDSLFQMKVKSTLHEEEKIGDYSMYVYQWIRAAGLRYDGLGARVKLDFSSMVSGLWYPVNMTNPDPLHPKFKRLAATPIDKLRIIKDRVQEIAKADYQTFLIDWRYIVDSIVERFSDRIASMAHKDVTDVAFINEIQAAALSHVDAVGYLDSQDRDAVLKQSIKDCMDHYLYPALPFSKRWNQADHMLYHSVITVMNDTCTTFIQGWSDLREASGSDGVRIRYRSNRNEQRIALERAKTHVKQLTARLRWTTWLKPRACPVDEVNLVVMWPYGNKEDHSNPGCRKISELDMDRSDYWNISIPIDIGEKPPVASLEFEEL